jgi:peptidoglycan/xylan/chitin deacetylase (PgdA/CDA1 family)
LGVDDISALEREGFEIGSHGMDHVPWTDLDAGALKREIMGSKIALQEILGRDVHSAALPFGAYNRRVLSAVRAAGYGAVYSSDPGWSKAGRWFRRRWSYRTGGSFEIDLLAAVAATYRHRLLAASKSLIKSLR